MENELERLRKNVRINRDRVSKYCPPKTLEHWCARLQEAERELNTYLTNHGVQDVR